MCNPILNTHKNEHDEISKVLSRYNHWNANKNLVQTVLVLQAIISTTAPLRTVTEQISICLLAMKKKEIYCTV